MNPRTKSKAELPDFWKYYESSFKIEFPEKLSEVHFLVLDTETTGFDLKEDRILSIGALKIQNATIAVKDAFEVFVQQNTFNSKTVKIHGILKRGRMERINELEAIKKLLGLLKNSVIVAHHSNFDIGMINEALKRHGLPRLLNHVLDTAELYHKSLPKPKRRTKGHYSLDELAEKFAIPRTDRHTALGDAYITAMAFLHILEKLKPITLPTLLKKDGFWKFWS